MSGIEVAGLVLGTFPLVLAFLKTCREGFEPLDDWWHFRTKFIEFVDDIEHQKMLYRENMIRLLDPIVVDNESLQTLVQDPNDPRWKDGTLDQQLEQRLASESDRFLRTCTRMEQVMQELKGILGVKDDGADFIKQKPFSWHLTRLMIVFSKDRHEKRVRKLAGQNQTLQEILGYSERIIPVAEARKSCGSDPVALFEKIRQHACNVHNALKKHWKCSGRPCRTSHQAHLRVKTEVRITELDLLFIMHDDGNAPFRSQEVKIQPAKPTKSSDSVPNISYVSQQPEFRLAQKQMEDLSLNKKRSSFRAMFSRSPSTSKLASVDGKTQTKQTRFGSATVTSTSSTESPSLSKPVIQLPEQDSSMEIIQDLCTSLSNCREGKFGFISDEYDRHFQLCKPQDPGPAINIPTAKLVSLPDILDAHFQAQMRLSRAQRLQIAANLASAFLQVQHSPWVQRRWERSDFYFLTDMTSLCSAQPYISRTFIEVVQPTATHDPRTPGMISFEEEEDTRTALFTVGVMVLELIFGQPITACPFRKNYYGPDGEPNDLTDANTAEKWSKAVLGEYGPEISEVIRRCLHCALGPAPNMSNARFREAVYKSVIQPLADALKPWQAEVQ